MSKRVHCTQVLDSEQTQKPLPDSGERLGNGGANRAPLRGGDVPLSSWPTLLSFGHGRVGNASLARYMEMWGISAWN